MYNMHMITLSVFPWILALNCLRCKCSCTNESQQVLQAPVSSAVFLNKP